MVRRPADFYGHAEETHHEIVTLHIGPLGNVLGERMWKIYCQQHHIDQTTSCLKPLADTSFGVNAMFREAPTSKKQYIPRCILVDLGSSEVDAIRKENPFLQNCAYFTKNVTDM